MKMQTLLLLLLAACAQGSVRPEKMAVQAPIVVANKVCETGSVTAEVKGKQMTCQRRTEVGSYMAQCLCWDAAYAEQQNLVAQGSQRQGMPIDPCGGSASCFMQGQVSSVLSHSGVAFNGH